MNEMTVTSAQYTSYDGVENDAITAVINGKTLSVPLDPANRHYIALMEWASEDGNIIQDAD